jgi:hypothetical protein
VYGFLDGSDVAAALGGEPPAPDKRVDLGLTQFDPYRAQALFSALAMARHPLSAGRARSVASDRGEVSELGGAIEAGPGALAMRQQRDGPPTPYHPFNVEMRRLLLGSLTIPALLEVLVA